MPPPQGHSLGASGIIFNRAVFRSHFLVDCSASSGSWHGAIAAATSLDVIAVHSSCSVVVVHAQVGLFLSVIVDVFEVEGVDMAGEVSKDSETYVDLSNVSHVRDWSMNALAYQKVCAAASDHEDADRRQEDGDDDQEDLRNHIGL